MTKNGLLFTHLENCPLCLSAVERFSLQAKGSTMKKLLVAFSGLLMLGLVAQFGTAQEEGQSRPERPADGERGPREGGRRGPGGPGGPRGEFSMMKMLPVLVALDADKDGEISEKEIANATAALKTLDKNKDGKLTEDEVRPDFGGRRGGPGGDRPRRPGAEGGDRPEGDRPARPERPKTDEN